MQVGSPRELYESPDNVFVAQFIGSPKMNLMPCSTDNGRFLLDGHNGGSLTASTQSPATQVGIRPEHVTLVPGDQGHCNGVVQVSEYLGADFFHHIDCGALGVLTVRTSGATEDIEGKTVGLHFNDDNLHFFDGDQHALKA